MAKEFYDNAFMLQQIWTSAYSAAFVADFMRCKEILGGFDVALETASAEAAETVADRAVAEWLRWNREGKYPTPRATPKPKTKKVRR